MKANLIVALDVPATDLIPKIVDGLPHDILYYKVGLQLFTADGPAALRPLQERNKKIFLDIKLHDIPRTVANSVAAAMQHGISILTVHAAGGRDMLKAAADAARQYGAAAPKLVAVTTLTSLNQSDLVEIGVTSSLQDHTLRLAELALESGIDGLVCSPNEVKAFRSKFGDKPVLVTPGIRPPGAAMGDQKRAATPRAAAESGSNYLVVGRPILDAPNPHDAAAAILRDIR